MSQLPQERIVKIQSGLSKIEVKNRYLEAFMDRDTTNVENAYELAMLKENRAELKAKLRSVTSKEEIDVINNKIHELTNKIGG